MDISLKELLQINKSVYKNCWKVSKKNSVGIIIALIFSSSTPYLLAYVLNLIIGLLTTKSGFEVSNPLIYMVISLVFLGYSLEISTGLQNFTRNRLSLLLESEYSRLVNSKLLQLPIWKFESIEFSNFIARVKSSYASRPVQYFVESITFLKNIVEIFIAIFILSTLNIYWVLILVLSFLPHLFLSVKLAKEQYVVWIKNTELYRKYGHVEWMFTFKPALSEIKAYKADKFFLEKISVLLDKVRINSEKILKKNFSFSFFINLLPYLAFFFILFKTSTFVVTRALGVGIFTLYFYTLQRMLNSLSIAVSGLSRIFENAFFVREVNSLINLEVGESRAEKPLPVSPKPSIEFKDVSFKYPLTEKMVLKKINLKINFGERVALVGENGAGKSTIVGLLLKFYDATEGQILINGVDIKNIDNSSWYKTVSPMFQNLTNFNFTVEDFITLGEKIDYQKLEKVCKLSNCYDMIQGFEDKYKQQLGKYYSDGEELSGGQWQRLTLARALYKDSDILILDEPTSSLDPKAEIEIFENLETYHDEKTLLFISHRFTTIRKADRIVYLENGEIKGDGNHEKLMKENAAYKKIFEEQAKSFR